MTWGIEGKAVLVTAGAAGLGRVIAESFADAGALVFACDIDGAALAALRGERPDIETVEADVASEADVTRLFDAIAARSDGVSILVNNAGIAGPTAAAGSISLADWERTLAVNLTGQFLCVRAALPAMTARRDGAIVNIASASARTGLPLRLPYVVSKVAVLGLTRNLARELGPDGIRVNAILPGPLSGARMERVIAAKAAALGVSPGAYAADLTRYVALRRFIAPEEVAAMVLHLASRHGRAVTGQLIGVDGHLEYEA